MLDWQWTKTVCVVPIPNQLARYHFLDTLALQGWPIQWALTRKNWVPVSQWGRSHSLMGSDEMALHLRRIQPSCPHLLQPLFLQEAGAAAPVTPTDPVSTLLSVRTRAQGLGSKWFTPISSTGVYDNHSKWTLQKLIQCGSRLACVFYFLLQSSCVGGGFLF